jgi:hypothetical protein
MRTPRRTAGEPREHPSGRTVRSSDTMTEGTDRTFSLADAVACLRRAGPCNVGVTAR